VVRETKGGGLLYAASIDQLLKGHATGLATGENSNLLGRA